MQRIRPPPLLCLHENVCFVSNLESLPLYRVYHILLFAGRRTLIISVSSSDAHSSNQTSAMEGYASVDKYHATAITSCCALGRHTWQRLCMQRRARGPGPRASSLLRTNNVVDVVACCEQTIKVFSSYAYRVRQLQNDGTKW